MPIISLIAAIDEKQGLGKNNQLLCHLPADLTYFKSMTTGKPIIMGRKTYESIGRPLPNRLNIVLSRRVKTIEGVLVAGNLDDAFRLAGDADEIMVIGGENVFSKALAIATRLYLTNIHHQFDADVYFPSFNEAQWQCVSSFFQSKDEKNAYDLTFKIYERF